MNQKGKVVLLPCIDICKAQLKRKTIPIRPFWALLKRDYRKVVKKNSKTFEKKIPADCTQRLLFVRCNIYLYEATSWFKK